MVTNNAKLNKRELVLDLLGRDIAAGVFAVGEKIPPEPELELRFEASRSVIREAIKGLVAKGMISVGPRLGTRVNPMQEWGLLDRDVLQWLLTSPNADKNLYFAIDEVRAMIEPTSAMLAAQRATPAQVAEIRKAFTRMQQAAVDMDVDAAVQSDRDFHIAVLKATQNPVLQAFDNAVGAILGVLFVTTHMEHFTSNLGRHGEVLDAIANKQPFEAAQAMTRVIGFTTELLKQNQIIGNKGLGGEL